MTERTLTPARAGVSRTAFTVAMIVAVICGSLVAVQSRVNGELGAQLGNGYVAALISFVIGLVILGVVLLFWAPGRVGLRIVGQSIRTKTVPWWHFCGGAGGAFLVLSQGLTAAILGVALFTVATVCGQTVSGLLIDRSGLGTMLPKALTYTRLIGTILVLAAVIWAVSADLGGDVPLWALIMPLLAGLAVGWQQAVNGQVRQLSGSALTATFVNFVVGTAVLAIVAVVHSIAAGWPTHLPGSPVLYIGGVVGVVFIAGAAILVRTTGVLLLGLGTIAGQLVGSLILDLALPTPGHIVAWTTIAGTTVVILALILAAVPSRPIRAPRV